MTAQETLTRSKAGIETLEKKVEFVQKLTMKTPDTVALSRYLPPGKLATEYFSFKVYC